jgi:hypothetical protein
MARIEDPVDYELVVGGNIARLLQAVPVRIPRNVE